MAWVVDPWPRGARLGLAQMPSNRNALALDHKYPSFTPTSTRWRRAGSSFRMDAGAAKLHVHAQGSRIADVAMGLEQSFRKVRSQVCC